jgi:hypothetical protein
MAHLPRTQWIARLLRGAAVAMVAVGLLMPMTAALTGPAQAQDSDSTKDRKEQEKAQQKKDKEFNREIQFRRVVGPKVLALGPYSVSLFVQGQPVEGRVRVAVQANSVSDKTAMDGQKWAINGILYPLAVRMFEDGRPTPTAIRDFKGSAYELLSKRYPGMVDEVFIESLI